MSQSALISFRFPDSFTHDTLHPILVGEHGLRYESRDTINRCYLDSFDWRVFRKGFVLEADQEPDGVRLIKRDLTDGSSARYRLPAMPAVAGDVLAGDLQGWLAKILGIRALTPLATIRCRITRYTVRDAEDKILARLEVQRDSVGKSALGCRLLIQPVRGYENEADHLLRSLRKQIPLKQETTDPMFLAVAASGRQPGDYSQKVVFHFDPYQRSDSAAKDILLDLLDTIERNEDGTIKQLDTEFLHDLRVAVRRSRSLIGQVKGIFPEQRLNRFKRELGEIGSFTGESRDMDVYLLEFDKLKAGLPKKQRADLEPLRSYLQEQHTKAYAELGEALTSASYKHFKTDWHRFLKTPSPRVSSLPNAMRPVQHVANERIWKVYRKVMKEGQGITPESPHEDLHELRKTCKKLRYLMEFFRSLYAAEDINGRIKELKKLQDFLGVFNDLEVQSGKLSGLEADMREQNRLPEATGVAMESLAAHMIDEQNAMRSRFETLFAEFASPETKAHFRSLFKGERT